jgi:hypothetical protein
MNENAKKSWVAVQGFVGARREWFISFSPDEDGVLIGDKDRATLAADAPALLDALEGVVKVDLGWDKLCPLGFKTRSRKVCEAIRLLAKHGRCKIVSDDDNGVLAEWRKE